MSTTAEGKTRFERRKEATRGRIVHAANTLFLADGYVETSMEDIARAADVAIRTIYLHFDSKAAILLAYFDEWLDDFVDALIARPAAEPIDESVARALDFLVQNGWDGTPFGEMPGPHPTVEFIGTGSPEIAGRIMHGWGRAQDALTAHYAASGEYPAGSFVPRARAAAVFASWVATLLVFRDGFGGAPLDAQATGNSVGEAIIREMNSGRL
ncbi:TetR/AcrR family transcriptional regulator [Salinibacterium soli]|uniref:TetR/AcrR family transcriptional regulator n=1 Tax=Antiquaquibacter soli TaxID=3064523 RepID=A0ABT9BK68_9MICO|nr:TetR/AcrR family transcriptional regulator [Protaetiibacter sp. WY-16]MDO7881416.1 TetR/AcrR family transcriptional regulator [Protaetiibacter sp. WY-16]